MAIRAASSAPPPAVVILPPALLNLFPGSSRQVEVAGSTVGEVIDALDHLWPGMGACLRDSRPGLRRHINVFVAGERASLSTRLPPGAEVFIVTAISGG